MSDSKSKLYVPIMKFKQGEYFALRDLKPETKEFVYPLFEIMPIPWDYENEEPAKSLDAHLSKVTANIANNWEGRPFMLDFRFITEDQCNAMPPHPIITLAEEAKDAGLHLVPVLSLNSPECLKNAVRDVAASLGHGIALRIVGDDFDNPLLDADIESLYNTRLGLQPNQVDIIVDLGQIPADGLTPLIVGMRNLMRMIPPEPWRSLSMVASAFPENLSAIPSGRGKLISRGEWKLWQGLVAPKLLRREPNFGDYTIVHPNPFEMDPRVMRSGAKIKYTTQEDWLVLKGKDLRNNGFVQYRDLAQQITELEYYCG
ncbi:MAG: beta family protein, partial [Holophaga sp.]|nr:beta family protein [Holophaga sp.]